MALVFAVEDDEGILELITCALQAGEYHAEGFTNGKKFFRRLHETQPDLILLDIMLPDEDGISILKRLKREALTADIPVIMLSAKGTELDKVNGLENGADDYIAKPFGVKEMLSRVKAVLRRSKTEPQKEQNLLRTRNLTVDLDRRGVTIEGRKVVLTLKEFELLACLLANQGDAVSREQLLKRVWGFLCEGETRTVDAHVSTLRQKLEAAGCPNLIRTVRGYGYQIGG